MESLFADYDLLSKCDLFDIGFYIDKNPDVAISGLDPIVHYLEFGAQQRREPHPAFDTKYYLSQCLELGEEPENALLHYLRFGMGIGLRARPTPPDPGPAAVPAGRIMLDRLELVTQADGEIGLRGSGWLVMLEPVAGCAIELDGEQLGSTAYGISRPDVAAMYPDYPYADQSGFTFSLARLPRPALATVKLTLSIQLASGERVRHPFQVELPPDLSPSGQQGDGAWRRGGLDSMSVPPMLLQADNVTVDEAGILTIDAWATCLVPIIAVDIFLDDELLGPAEFGLRREDVGAAYPLYLNPEFSGIRFAADVARLGSGPRTLKIRCAAKGGLQRELLLPLNLQTPSLRRRSIDQGIVRLQCDEFELTTDGLLSVIGWAVCPIGIEAISIVLDDIEVGQAELGFARPDVGNIFPDIPAARTGGFGFRGVIVSAGIAGEHVLSVRVRTSEGEAGEMHLPIAAVDASTQAEGISGSQSALAEVRIAIDSPAVVNGAATAPIRSSLSINGWGLAPDGVAGVDVAIDGVRITSAYYGVRRDDVAAAFPDRAGALLSGFAALIPNRALPKGRHNVCLTLLDKVGNTASLEFSIEVEEMAEELGPWSLRRKMNESEVDIDRRVLSALGWRPSFQLLILSDASDEHIEAACVTLSSLSQQVYGDWSLLVAPRSKGVDLSPLKRRILSDFEDLTSHVAFLRPGSEKQFLDELVSSALPERADYMFGLLSAGDELGVDALLQFAKWTALNRDVDLAYCDERRINPGSGKVDAFFKPGWSPDLMLSSNYIGRSFCLSSDLLSRARVSFAALQSKGEYDFVLRCCEMARNIQRIPHVLYQRSGLDKAEPVLERAALKQSIKRRGIKGTVADGCAAGIYQLKRAHGIKGLVSIVMPTCAARGLVKICIETLKAKTRYRNFEIVCIENIPEHEKPWQDWLRGAADKVLTTTEQFNWSRFNNLAAAQARGEYLVFLNDDIEIISPDWLDVLLSQVQRPEVGVVGPLLLYPDRSIQHAGLFLTRMGTARHAFRYGPEDDPGYFGLALTQRNVIGVTGACLMVRRDTFDRVNGFDETHTVINNDLDFCLRVWEAGLLNVFTAQTKLIHHELASRSEISDDYDSTGFDTRWGDVFLRGDPYFHPSLSKDHDDYSADHEPLRVVCAGHPMLAADRVRRLLIVKLDHIGDCVTAIPAVNRLRALFPDARISVLAGRSTKAIWSMVPGIDEVIEFDFFHARSGLGQTELTEDDLLALRDRLAPYRFDLAVDLRKSPDTRLMLQCSGAPYLAGFGHHTDFPWLDIAVEWEGDPKFQKKQAHVSDDLMRLAEAIGLACNVDRTVVAAQTGPSPLPEDLASRLYQRRVVALHPAAGTPTRQWPAEYFAQLIDLLVEGHDVNVAVIGGPDETDIADAIMAAVRHQDHVEPLLGKLKLNQTIEFLPSCALFIGNNSGPSHIAAALGVPTVAVHSGVIASEEWGPFGPTGVAIRRDMSCAPCYIAQPEDCHRRLACLGHLSAGDVLEVCRGFLGLGAGRSPELTNDTSYIVNPDLIR